MRFQIDHDLHIHSQISSCSGHPEQTAERILYHAKENGLSTVCVTDHFWDSDVPGASEWYRPQNFEHIKQILPLPKADDIRFLFGSESDLDRHLTLGISQKRFEDFDFVILPTTHLHMNGFTITEAEAEHHETRALLWVKRLEHILSLPLPFYKIGIAHLACSLLDRRSREDFVKTIQSIPDEEMARLFTKASALGCGIELNQSDMSFQEDYAEVVLRPFRIAKACGCKFYLGSDAHAPKHFTHFREVFERAITRLNLTEKDKFHI